jgi:hypothetical protein
MTHRNCHSALLVMASVCVFAGCQALVPTGAKNWFGQSPKIKESQYSTPVKLAAVWTPAVLNQAGMAPTRGFGGRLYFYDANNRPVAVEGQLVVYAYNDSKPGADGRTPDAKYAFTPEQFTTHYTPTELGASYSIWIPWDHVGAPRMEVTLVPIFTAASGQLVMGQSSHNLLAGPGAPLNQPEPVRRSELPLAEMRRDPGVQPAAFQGNSVAGSARQPSPGVEMLTLKLPTTLAERLALAGPQTAKGPAPTAAAQLPAHEAANPSVGPPGVAPAPPPATVQRLGAPGAIPPPWFPRTLPPTRSEPPRLPVPDVRDLQQAAGRTPTPPFPAGSPFALPATH